MGEVLEWNHEADVPVQAESLLWAPPKESNFGEDWSCGEFFKYTL